MERFAGIDIGTNSVLLLVAERRDHDGRHELVAVEQRATITRLGEGVDRTGRLAETARARTLACLTEYAECIEALGVDAIDVVGTSAMRDASGGQEFALEVASILGVSPRVIGGEEEAELTFLGAISGLELQARSLLVFDIGGGSTELVGAARGARGFSMQSSVSLDIGSVRLYERCQPSDPPTEAEYLDLARVVSRALDSTPTFESTPTLIGVAGTMTTLAAIELGLSSYDREKVHGFRLTLGALTALRERLWALPLERRKELSGLHPLRADVILAGVVIAEHILRRVGADACLVSDRGVRWGLAERAL